MDKDKKIRIIRMLEERYKNDKSYFSASDISHNREETDFLSKETDLFFPASKSRVIMMHWLCREVRRVYEKVNFVPIDIANEVYEHLRKHFNTKALNKAKLLKIFGLTNNTILNYEDFNKIENAYIDSYNKVVENDMKLPKVKHIYVQESSECNGLREELSLKFPKERIEEIIYERSIGKTLDAIGKEYNITRERARQIEIKPKALIERWMDERRKDIIKACGGNILVDPKKAEECLGNKYWSIIKYCAKSKGKRKYSNWNYIKELDTICYSNEFPEDIYDIIKECSDNGLSETETIAKIQEKYKFMNEKNIKEFFGSVGCYSYDGKMYSTKMNIGRGIVAAVNEKFTDGIKISDPVQLKKFADYLNETYGLKVKPNRALTARIQDILVMSDKATYKSPKYVNSSEKLNSLIKEYVESIENDRTTYQALFDAMPKDIMKDCGIDTFQGLHGYVKKNESTIGVVALRYYICKENTDRLKSKDFFEKFCMWLIEQNKPCSTEEILAEFTDWTEMYPKYAMLYYPQIVQWGNGSYFNLDCIKVSKKGIEQAEKVLRQATDNKYRYTNSYVVSPILKKEAPEFLKDKRIKTESHIYLLLKYNLMDKKEFVFAKPHILHSSVMGDKTDFTTEDLVRRIIGKRNVISKAEVSEEIQKYFGSKNSSLCLATQHVLNDYLRINNRDFYKKSAVNFKKKDIEQIEKFVEKNMINGKVMLPGKVYDYSGLPKAPFDWNSWALCSIIEIYSKKYRIMFKRNNVIQNHMAIVSVDSEYKTKDDINAAIA